MRRSILASVLLGTVLTALSLLGGPEARAEVNPYEPVEVLPYQGRTGVDIVIAPRVDYDPAGGTFTYRYRVTSLPSSRQDLWQICVETTAEMIEDRGPENWDRVHSTGLAEDGKPVVFSWGPMLEHLASPGTTTEGFMLRTEGLPAVVNTYVEGDVPPPSGQQIVLPAPNDEWPDCAVKGRTVGPVPPASVPLEPPAFLDRLADLKHQAFDLGWITNQGIVNSLDQKLDNAKQKVQQGQRKAAVNLLQAFLQELDAQRGKHLDENAYYLLRPNAEFLIDGLNRLGHSGAERLAVGAPGPPPRQDADRLGAAGTSVAGSAGSAVAGPAGSPAVRPPAAIQAVALAGLLGLVTLPGLMRRRVGHGYS